MLDELGWPPLSQRRLIIFYNIIYVVKCNLYPTSLKVNTASQNTTGGTRWFRNIEGQLAKWIEELAVYNMEIVHQPGKDHVNADGMSRIPDPLVQCNYYSYGCDLRTCHAVAESTVYGRMNSGIGFTMRWTV